MKHPYKVVIYPEEEGTRFGAVLTGSKAWVGELRGLREQICDRRGLSCMRMPSGAVHDAQVMAQLVETGMIFIPSRGGRSHCPEEYPDPGSVEQGINVLLDAVVALAG